MSASDAKLKKDLFEGSKSLFRRPPGSEHHVLHPWVTINLVVALLVGLAWVLIASRPETDYTEGEKQQCKL